ncbi:MAG: DUF4062 domain-containing protein, partial [Chloroflexi bacterium]|nr:DUF4062 domain-containing protein [Chloroflexota bacterium]
MTTQAHPAAPTVFISSVVKEFWDFRDALAFVLRERGCVVNVSEEPDFYISGDKTAVEECFSNAETSDFFILLVGDHTGTIYNTENHISITRMEFRRARDAQKRNGQPALLMFLKASTAEAVKSKPGSAAADSLEEFEHTRSFVEEIQKPIDPEAPSFLKRFRQFQEVANPVFERLNLGRNVSESVTRHLVRAELAENLGKMVERHLPTARVTHQMLRKIRDEIPLDKDDISGGRPIRLDGQQLISLGYGFIGRTYGRNLSTDMMQRAIGEGVFLKLGAPGAGAVVSNSHRALVQIVRDIESLTGLDEDAASPDHWAMKLNSALANRPRGQD